MKKAIIAGVIVVLVIGGGYLVFHKAAKATPKAATAASSVPAVNNAVVTTKTNSSLGQYLADPSGMALYTYGGDTSGVSNCTGSCLSEWPAYQDTGSTTDLPAGISTIKRTDNGQTQYTYNGMPLYTFVSDSKGHVTGDNVDKFHVAIPATATSTQSTTTAPSSTSTKSTNSSSSSNPYHY